MSRIIAADDDIGLQRIYFYMLDCLGHETVICCNGEEALSAFQQGGADLVILDITMPVMDGLEACRRIKQLPEGVNVPVIIVSANDTEAEITAGFNAGADDYMVKPIQENILIAKLKNFLKTSSLHRLEFDLVKKRVVFQDRYRIMKVIGYGAHSVVFLANDQKENNRQVAVKLLNEKVSDAATQRLFIATVSRFQALDSPYIVKIFDYGVFNGQIFVVMEYASGNNLRQLLTAHRLEEKEVCELALNMLSALEKLNESELAHLDIKPENIICCDGVFKLADFGLIDSKSSGTMPLHAEIWSTAAYICPEYLEDTATPGIKGDIYSLGESLFEAVIGDNPFYSGNATVSMFRQVNLIPPYISNQTEKISFEFSDVIASMMSKNPDDRPALSTLREWFQYILNCHLEGKTSDLSYPRPAQQKTMVSQQEEALKKRRRLSLLPKKQTLLHKFGNRIYNSIMMTEHKSIDAKIEHVRKILYIAMMLALTGFLSFMAVRSMGYGAAGNSNIPEVRIICGKCGTIENRRIKDIRRESCRKCGGTIGQALKCAKCQRVFPWQKPEIPPGTRPKNRQAVLKASMVCPSCGSTTVVPFEQVEVKKK